MVALWIAIYNYVVIASGPASPVYLYCHYKRSRIAKSNPHPPDEWAQALVQSGFGLVRCTMVTYVLPMAPPLVSCRPGTDLWQPLWISSLCCGSSLFGTAFERAPLHPRVKLLLESFVLARPSNFPQPSPYPPTYIPSSIYLSV